MSTKNVTTSTNQYDPASLGAYQNLSRTGTQQMGQQITSPYNNPFMQRLQGIGQGAAAGFSRGVPSYTGANNMAFQRANLAMSGRQSNALLQGGAQWRNQSLMSAMNYRPLQTGGTMTQSTTGAGTWLAPAIGMGTAALEGYANRDQNSITGAPRSVGPEMGGMDTTGGNALASSQAWPTMTPSSNYINSMNSGVWGMGGEY